MLIEDHWFSWRRLGWLGLLLGLTGWGCTPSVRKNTPPPATPLHLINLPQAEDNVDYPLSTLRGKVVLIDFFSSSCMPCLYIIPQLKSLYRANRQKGFLVIGIALEQQVKQILLPFLAYMKIDYPVLVADEHIYRGTTIFGKILQIPQSILIDRCGKIRYVHVGVPDMKKIQRQIGALMAQPAKACTPSPS